MTYLEMKAHREQLWAQLNDVIARKTDLDAEEKSIRDQVKEIQAGIFNIEAKHSINRIEGMLERGEVPDDEVEEKKAKVEQLKQMIGL